MVVCKYYQTGFCRFGDRCRFEHIDRVNYPSNNSAPRYPDQYVGRFPGSNYINNQITAANVAPGSGYNQRGSMITSKKPEQQYHYVTTIYDRQFQASGGQSFNHQNRPQHSHNGHSGAGNIGNSSSGASGAVHQTQHHHSHHQQQQQQQQHQPHQQHGIIPAQYWQAQQQRQQVLPTPHHHQSHSNNQRQTLTAHHGHGQGQSGGQHHQLSSQQHGSGGQHHQQQSSGFSFNQKLKEIESSQKPQVGFSFNRTLQQIHQYQPHLAQQMQNQYYLTPTPMLTVPVQTPYYGVTMPMSMAHNPLASMFPSMLPTNNADPKMISSYLPQQTPQGKISMNLSDDDSGVYSIMSSLTPEELNQYKADKFTFPHIPINPPPKELCL